MQNFDELRREAEETKERLRRDILELHDIVGKIARESGDRGRNLAEESIKQAETRIEEAISQAEKRFESALAAVTGCNFNYDDFITRELDIKDFASIEADCAFRLDITQSRDFHVSVWASDALQKEVSAVKSGILLSSRSNRLPFQRPSDSAGKNLPAPTEQVETGRRGQARPPGELNRKTHLTLTFRETVHWTSRRMQTH